MPLESSNGCNKKKKKTEISSIFKFLRISQPVLFQITGRGD